MADLYLTPAEKYTAALGGFYYGDLPEPGTVYTQLIKDILDGSTPDKEPKNILARFIYSLYISDLGDPYPRYELAKLLYWKLHDITPTKSGSILTVTIDGKEDYMTINTDLSRLWYKVLFGSKTDVITEFPYIFNTMQNKLSDWKLFGNTVQSGTPTPDNPIMPNGTGERTGNLFDKTKATLNAVVTSDAGERPYTGFAVSDYISVLEGTYYLTNVAGSKRQITLSTFDAAKTFTGTLSISGSEISSGTVTIDNNTKYIRVNMSMTDNNIDSVMVNSGTTALPHEPYGYKIPISTVQTTPIYLGSVQSTRQVKKLVFTGREGWNNDYGQSLFGVQSLLNNAPFIAGISAYSTHFIYNPVQSGLDSAMSNGEFALQKANNLPTYNVFLKNTAFTSKNDFKAWLAAQYAAGTPVTIWYVLANPETAVVNEPLMKIGYYADSMSRTQTGIDIPTVVGQNTLDVLTTVKPSSMRIEYTSADGNQSRSNRISLLKSPLKKRLIK